MYDTYGYCMQCGPSPDVSDSQGHGTHVSGIVAALRDVTNNVAGIAPKVKIMPLKVGQSCQCTALGWHAKCMLSGCELCSSSATLQACLACGVMLLLYMET